MKRIHGKFLIALAIPVITAVLPSVAFATCTGGVPDGPPSWDPSVIVPKTATIGWGTDIGAGSRVGYYASIGQCGTLGMDNSGILVAKYSKLGNGVTMTNASLVGLRASVGDNVLLDGSSVYNEAVIAGGNITNSTVGEHTHIGTNAAISGSQIARYVSMGSNNTVTGGFVGYRSKLGDFVTVDSGAQIRKYVTVDSNVHIGAGAIIGRNAHVCADVNPGMLIKRYSKFGCN